MHRSVCDQWTHDLLVLPKGLFTVNPNQLDSWNWLEISSEQALQRDFWHFCFQYWLKIEQKETPASSELFCQIWRWVINSQKIIVACSFSAFCFPLPSPWTVLFLRFWLWGFFRTICQVVSANNFRYFNNISDLQYKQAQQDSLVTWYTSEFFTWMSIHLRNRLSVQICATPILKLFHGYFGLLPQNSPLPQTFLTQCLSALALPSRECGKNRNTIKARYLRKYLQQVSKKRVGGVSPDGGISMEEAVKCSNIKKEHYELFKLQDVSEMNVGINIRLFRLVLTAALAYHGDAQGRYGKKSSWPHSNIVLFVVPEGFQWIFICGFGQRNAVVNLPSLISVCKLKASWEFINSLIHYSCISGESFVFSVLLYFSFVSAELLVGSSSDLHMPQSRVPEETAGPRGRTDS